MRHRKRSHSQFVDLVGRGLVRTPPKSRAGAWTITVPAAIRPELVAYLRDFVAPRADALIFTMLRGGLMRRGNFNPLVKWGKAVAGIGAPLLWFHDLRHTGNTLAEMGRVASGASFGKICELPLPATSPFELDQGRLAEASSHAS